MGLSYVLEMIRLMNCSKRSGTSSLVFLFCYFVVDALFFLTLSLIISISFQAAMGATSNLNTIFIVSDTGDRVHNGDIKSILKDMCSIHKQLVSSLPTPKTALVQQEIDPTKFSKQMIKGDFQIIKAGATGSK